MKQAVRDTSRQAIWPTPQFLQPPRSEHLTAAGPSRISDIILGMTLVVLAIVLVVWLLGQIFSQDEQALIDIENINAGVSHEPV